MCDLYVRHIYGLYIYIKVRKTDDHMLSPCTGVGHILIFHTLEINLMWA